MSEPISPAYREQMNQIARSLDTAFNGDKRGKDKTTGFILLMFPFDAAVEGARTNYISNADRKDIVVALKEIVARFEGQPEIKGHG